MVAGGFMCLFIIILIFGYILFSLINVALLMNNSLRIWGRFVMFFFVRGSYIFRNGAKQYSTRFSASKIISHWEFFHLETAIPSMVSMMWF